MSNVDKIEKDLEKLRKVESRELILTEKSIRKIYKDLLKNMRAYLSDLYVRFSNEDVLTYGDLAIVGMDARVLEDMERIINTSMIDISKEINKVVNQTYEACYKGMQLAVQQSAGDIEVLAESLESIRAITPEVVRRAVQNPVSGLTLKDTLEKHRKDIIYDIKRNIGVGLANGDRYSSMARRITESLDGDYKKSIRVARTEAHRVRESGISDAATDINNAFKEADNGYVLAKTWRTMQDERVRPNVARKTKSGVKYVRKGRYNHMAMEGVRIAQDKMFKLPSGATCMCPSQTGVAGEDINCRCYLSYDLALESELSN